MSELTYRALAEIERFHRRLDEAPLHVDARAEEIAAHLARYRFDEPEPGDRLIGDVAWMLWEWTEHARNPRHFGLTRPTVDELSIVADLLAALFDPNLATWEFAPAANEIERHTLHELARRSGWDALTAAAHFTSGGQEANHTAVAVALTHRFPAIGERGLRAVPNQPVMYLSEEGHHSFDKIAHLTGIGRAAVRRVPVTDGWRIDPGALRRQIEADRGAGLEPFLVVGTAGTTGSGVVDPLDELADIAHESGAWFHVDAAWGGAACLSDRLRPLFAGIERADSVTSDAHKMLSVPVGAGMFFTRHPAAADATFFVDATYAPPRSSAARAYPFASTMQWSRRFIGLKVFMMLAGRGLGRVVERIEHQFALGAALRELLHEAGWRLLNDTPLPLVCFDHPHLRDARALQAVVDDVKARDVAWISVTRLAGRTPAIRASITNYETRRADLERLVEGLGDALP